VLGRAALRPDAPPVFLIDGRRLSGERMPSPGLFDNRWVVLPQDFPSAVFMASQRIDRVLVIQSHSGQPADDLAHVLLRWQEGRIRIATARIGSPAAEIQVARPSWFKFAWQTLMVTAGLRPNAAGGFGSVVPVPRERTGGGYFG
jgi:hypothetical protein